MVRPDGQVERLTTGNSWWRDKQPSVNHTSKPNTSTRHHHNSHCPSYTGTQTQYTTFMSKDGIKNIITIGQTNVKLPCNQQTDQIIVCHYQRFFGDRSY